MKYIFSVLLTIAFCTICFSQRSDLGKILKLNEYKITPCKVTGWGLCVVGGAAWGLHEAKYADPKVFEKNFGIAPYRWGGSQDWQWKYPGGRYELGEQPVLIKDKVNWIGESKKTTALFGRYLPITAGIVITMDKNRNWKDYVIGAVLYSGSAVLTYNYMRWGSRL